MKKKKQRDIIEFFQMFSFEVRADLLVSLALAFFGLEVKLIE